MSEVISAAFEYAMAPVLGLRIKSLASAPPNEKLPSVPFNALVSATNVAS